MCERTIWSLAIAGSVERSPAAAQACARCTSTGAPVTLAPAPSALTDALALLGPSLKPGSPLKFSRTCWRTPAPHGVVGTPLHTAPSFGSVVGLANATALATPTCTVVEPGTYAKPNGSAAVTV